MKTLYVLPVFVLCSICTAGYVDKLNVIGNEYTKTYNLYNTMTDYNSYNNTIILLYENNIHFKLIGHFKDNNMLSLFNHRNIPSEIYKLIMS